MAKTKKNNIRKATIQKTSRIVVKVGTRLLTDIKRIPALISQIVKLRARGIKVLLVSSGAVGLGMKVLNMDKRPGKLSVIQSLASIGQIKLMSLYESECRKFGFHASQLLLTADDLRDRERHLNVLNCINSLWNENILPIVNENDSVSVDELKFGDNDILAALLATMTRSELTVILTTVDGLYETKDGKFQKRIPIVDKISDNYYEQADDTDNKDFSIGGMTSKLRAAEIVTAAGECCWIADGRDDDIIGRILAGDDVGTIFLPTGKKQMQSKKRWIGFFSKRKGRLFIDQGAVNALNKKGRSLLPSGVIKLSGSFSRGDTVDVCDKDAKVIARGLINYSVDEMEKIKGLHSNKILQVLGYTADEVVIHRDNMVIFN